MTWNSHLPLLTVYWNENEVDAFQIMHGKYMHKEIGQKKKEMEQSYKVFDKQTMGKGTEKKIFFRAALTAHGSSQAKCSHCLYATATAMPYLSLACNLHHSSRQCQILTYWEGPRIKPCILMDTRQVRYHWATTGTPKKKFGGGTVPKAHRSSWARGWTQGVLPWQSRIFNPVHHKGNPEIYLS